VRPAEAAANPAIWIIRMARDETPPLDAQAILARVKGRSSRYPRDRLVYSQGDRADGVFYIQAGRIKVNVISEKGKEAVVAILSPGSFCGEECLAGHELRMSTVTALTECVLIRIPKAGVLRALHEDAEFSALFTAHLMERNIRIQEDLADQLLNSTERRLARLLLALADHGEEDRPDPIVSGINQETLARMIGTSRTHVNLFMNKFRQLGFIAYGSDPNGDIKVHRPLLEALLRERPQRKPHGEGR
jgi:CRP-like cAMP-binding protein